MKVIVVGGGPAGMMAAITSAENGNEVILLEKNDILGKKLLITGKGRCNITSSLKMDDFIKNTPGNGMFLYSAFNSFTNEDIITFLNNQGLKVKEERGNRIFPITDNARDVLSCFEKRLKQLNVEILYNTKVTDILVDNNNQILGVNVEKIEDKNTITNKMESNNTIVNKIESKNIIENKGESKYIIKSKTINGDKVILATGGKSYPLTGSTGDGYKLAQKVGHTITKIKPSLVPLQTYEQNLHKRLQGLSLRNVKIKMMDIEKNKVIYEDFGEMLFTHFGVSGPIILSGSAHLVRYKNIEELLKNKKVSLKIDFKPAISSQQLDSRILRDFEEFKNKEFKNSLGKLLPQMLIPVVIEYSKISPEKKVNSITKQERMRLIKILKEFEVTIKDFRKIDDAIITCGGINIKEVNPKTMESKKIQGLYFAGEILDVDSYTGGFNLQIAYSTGYVAGSL